MGYVVCIRGTGDSVEYGEYRRMAGFFGPRVSEGKGTGGAGERVATVVFAPTKHLIH